MRKQSGKARWTGKREGYHEIMCMVDLDFRLNPPAYLPYVEPWDHASNRNELQVWDMFYAAASSPNPPGWLPDIIYSYAKYYDRRNQLTQGQWRVVMRVYELLCWSDQLMDSRYHLWGLDSPKRTI